MRKEKKRKIYVSPRQVENVLQEQSADVDLAEFSPEEILQLIQGLQVQRIELEQQKDHLDLLYRLSHGLAELIGSESMAEYALKLTIEALAILRGEMFELDEARGRLCLLALAGYNPKAIEQYRLKAELRLEQGLAWRALQTKAPVIISDVNCSEHWLPIPGLDDEICSAAAFPLIVSNKLVGVMCLLSDQPDYFEPRLPLLTAIVTPVSLAMQNERLFTAEREARQVSETLRQASLAMNQTLDVDVILNIALDYLHQIVPYDRAAVLLEENQHMVVRAQRGYGTGPQPLSTHKLAIGQYPQLKMVATMEHPLLIPDIQAEPDWQPLFTESSGRSWLGAPLVASGEMIGVIIAEKNTPNFFIPQHCQLVEALAIQTTTATQNGQWFHQIQTARSRLGKLAGQLVNAQEAERRRVSRELHDEAGQLLNVLKICLGLIRDELPAEFNSLCTRLEDASELTEEALQKLRLIAYNLRPPELDTVGLDAALEDFCEEFSRRTQLAVQYEGTTLPTLPEPVLISFYRFLQEALTNVVKHAKASRVEVHLTYSGENVCLRVADNGQGFKNPVNVTTLHASAGLGLLGMKERFESLNGQMFIESKRNEGSTLTACVPWKESL
jgi:signal transduction histidine kinase